MKMQEIYTEKARLAVDELKPLLADAILEAKAALDENQSKSSWPGQRDALLQMLKDYQPEADGAESVLNNYLSSYVQKYLIQDGNHVLAAFSEVVRENLLRGDQARKAANALLAAQAGLIPSGLVVWPGLDEWAEKMSHKQLLVWVAILTPEQADKFSRKMERLTKTGEELQERFNKLNDVRLSALLAAC